MFKIRESLFEFSRNVTFDSLIDQNRGDYKHKIPISSKSFNIHEPVYRVVCSNTLLICPLYAASYSQEGTIYLQGISLKYNLLDL